jgi:LacI family transcriptional regulator
MRRSTRRKSAPTIADVAAAAGVSAMTVSRVINGEAKVKPSTRDQVVAAIQALNYAPNPAARSLAGAGQLKVALLYSNPSAGFLNHYLMGSLDQAARSDVQLVIEKCEVDGHELEVAEHLIERGIDGIVLPPPLCDSPAMLRLLAGSGVPTVLLATGSPPSDLLAVTIDNRQAADTMTRHLLSLGHRRIGFIGGDTYQTDSKLRFEGYQAALAEAGVAFDPALVVPGLYTYRSGLEAAEQLLGLKNAPTAIFSSNDDMAAATMAVAHRRGLDVPGDITVCGFDDTTLATAVWPPLTTIHQPIADMSRAALELLVATVRRKSTPSPEDRHRVLDYTLIRRQSDGEPTGARA